VTGEQAVDTDDIRESYSVDEGPEGDDIRRLCDEIDRLRAVADPALTSAAADYRQAWEAQTAWMEANPGRWSHDDHAAVALIAAQLHDETAALLRAARGEA